MPKLRFSQLFAAWRGFDWWLAAAVFLLTLFGLAALYSIGLGRPDTQFLDFKKQAVFFFIGLILMLGASRFNYVFYRSVSRPFYVFCLFLLLAVLFFGTTIRGTRGWFAIGSFSFQPVELAKIGLILILALFASRRRREFKTIGFFVGSGILTLASALLVILQPDFGSALLFLLIWLSVILMAGIRWRHLVVLFLVFCTLFSVGWFGFFKDYQKERFLTFFNSGHDPLGRGYNITQSIIAVGSGQFFGRGLGYGSQSQLRFLPEAHTDFIFAVIAEEMGFLGASLVLALFTLLFYRLFKIARQAKDDFGLFTVLGALILFVWQFLVNVGMNIGLLPVTGLTLPFLSAGGSSLLANFLLIGIVQSVARARA